MFSICDIITSVNYMIGPFLLPNETSFRIWSFGTKKTCTISGAIAQFGFSSYCYYSIISIYFILTVKYGISQAVINKYYIEHLMHSIAIGVPLIGSILGIIYDQYYETDLAYFCWISNRKTQCSDYVETYGIGDDDFVTTTVIDASNTPDDSCIVETEVGELSWFTAFIPVMICLFVIIICNVMIFLHVSTTTYKRYNRVHSKKKKKSSLAATAATTNTTISDTQIQRVRQVAIQALLYVFGFFLTLSVVITTQSLNAFEIFLPSEEDKIFVLLAYQAFAVPLVGFCNFLTN